MMVGQLAEEQMMSFTHISANYATNGPPLRRNSSRVAENAGYRTPPSKGNTRQDRINLLERSPVAGKNLIFHSPETN